MKGFWVGLLVALLGVWAGYAFAAGVLGMSSGSAPAISVLNRSVIYVRAADNGRGGELCLSSPRLSLVFKKDGTITLDGVAVTSLVHPEIRTALAEVLGGMPTSWGEGTQMDLLLRRNAVLQDELNACKADRAAGALSAESRGWLFLMGVIYGQTVMDAIYNPCDPRYATQLKELKADAEKMGAVFDTETLAVGIRIAEDRAKSCQDRGKATRRGALQ